jgi:hypothetical protein
MSDVPDKDFLEEEVESGLAPLRAMGLSPAEITEAANLLRMALTSHPTGRYLMNRSRPRVVQESGPTAVESPNREGSRGSAKAGSSR